MNLLRFLLHLDKEPLQHSCIAAEHKLHVEWLSIISLLSISAPLGMKGTIAESLRSSCGIPIIQHSENRLSEQSTLPRLKNNNNNNEKSNFFHFHTPDEEGVLLILKSHSPEALLAPPPTRPVHPRSPPTAGNSLRKYFQVPSWPEVTSMFQSSKNHHVLCHNKRRRKTCPALPAFKLVLFSCNSTLRWWRRDQFPLIAGKGGHGVCSIKSPQAKRFFLSSLRIPHGLLICSEKKRKTRKQTPSPRSNSTRGEAGVPGDLGKQRAELGQEVTLGWEVSIPAQEDKFGKDSHRTSTCCPTGMDAVCEAWHCFNALGQARVA